METITKSDLMDKVIELVKAHGKGDSEKVISEIGIRWTQQGYDLVVSGYSIEYKSKPVRKN